MKLRIVLERNFGSVFLMSLVVGGALYGILYLIPQYLTAVPGYNAQQSGLVVLISGVPTLLIMPLFPFLLKRVDIRIAVAFGLICYAVSCFLNSFLTPDSSGEQFFLSQILRGIGQAFSLLFLNAAATGSVGQDDREDASGLFNAARNLAVRSGWRSSRHCASAARRSTSSGFPKRCTPMTWRCRPPCGRAETIPTRSSRDLRRSGPCFACRPT